jgi:hypothetical protein
MKAGPARVVVFGFLLVLDVLLLIGGMKEEVAGARTAAEDVAQYLEQFRPAHIAGAFAEGEKSCWVVFRYLRGHNAACEGEDSPEGASLPVCGNVPAGECRDYHPGNLGEWVGKQIKVLFFVMHHIWGNGWLFVLIWAVGTLVALQKTDEVAAFLFGPITGTVIMVLVAWAAALVTSVFHAFLGLLLLINGSAAVLAWPLFLREWWKRGREIGEIGKRTAGLTDDSRTRRDS